MLIGVLSGVTGGVRSDSSFEFALKLPVNVASLLVSLPTLVIPLIDTSPAMALFTKKKVEKETYEEDGSTQFYVYFSNGFPFINIHVWASIRIGATKTASKPSL